MTKTVTVHLLKSVTFNGTHLVPGDEVELSEKSALALIEEGGAKSVEITEVRKAVEGDLSLVSNEGLQNPSDDKTDTSDEALELLTKALDDKYKGRVADLKDHAKEADVQFAHDATKAQVIEAVIAAEKGEAILAK